MFKAVIRDQYSFIANQDVLDGDDFLISPMVSMCNSHNKYGIYNDNRGWIKEIMIGKHISIRYTQDRTEALSILGNTVRGKLLTFGRCICLSSNF